jgi:hypothetical protein
MPEPVGTVLIELKAGARTILRLFASENGTVMFHGGPNRTLTGVSAEASDEATIDQSRAPLYFALREELDPHLAPYQGAHTLDLTGEPCSLFVGHERGAHRLELRYEYGSETDGPPPLIRGVVRRAVTLAESWRAEIGGTVR